MLEKIKQLINSAEKAGLVVNIEEKDIPLTPEEMFEHYISEFDLNPAELANKKILDVGCGKNPIFVNYCLENGITKDIYGIDPKIFLEDWDMYADESKEVYPLDKLHQSAGKKHYIQGDASLPPFRPETFDLILARAAVGAGNFDKILAGTIKILKKGGEIKIYPIWKGEKYPEWQSINPKLELLDPKEIEFEWKEQGSFTYPNETERLLKYLLTLRKK